MTAPILTEFRPAPAALNRPLRAVMFGCGVVNSGVLDGLSALERAPHLEAVVTRAGRRNLPAGALSLTEAGTGFDIGPDLVIEALPDGPAAERVLARAVEARAHIVSANKAVLARRPELERKARAQGSSLRYSAAVGGGVPVLETIERLAEARCPAERIAGVVNGTTNYVIDAIIDGASRTEAIADAQAAGFAEADPSADLDGGDAAAKLALIARKAFGATLDPLAISRQAFDTVSDAYIRAAARQGLRCRQVAELRREGGGLHADIRLLALPEDSALARPRREENVFEITGRDGLSVSLQGKGAGREPTAGAMLADIAAILACESSR